MSTDQLELSFLSATGFMLADVPSIAIQERTVGAIDKALANELVVRHHYLHRRPSNNYSFGLFEGSECVGVVVFGTPASRHLQMSLCPSDPGKVIELNRLWVHDDCPRNTESYFVARALRLLPPFIVASYSDTAWGHKGYVYRALGFKYAGWTDMERNQARYDYIPISEGHTRDAFRNGWSHRVRRKPKAKYWTVTGNRRERRTLARVAGWPDLDWHEYPVPDEHRKFAA